MAENKWRGHVNGLRNVEEIQRAHDALLFFAETPQIHGPFFRAAGCDVTVSALLCVLCWVLRHEESAFQQLLTNVEDLIKLGGYIPIDTERRVQ